MKKINNNMLVTDTILNYAASHNIVDEGDNPPETKELYQDDNGDIYFASYFQWDNKKEEAIQKMNFIMSKLDFAREVSKQFEKVLAVNELDDIADEDKNLAIECEMYLAELKN